MTRRILPILAALTLIGCAGTAIIDNSSTDGTTSGTPPYAASVARMKKLVGGLLIYVTDSDDVIPLSTTWMDGLEPYVRDSGAFVSPIFDGTGNYGYALNKAIAVKSMSSFPEPHTVVAIFDSTILTRNATASTATLPIRRDMTARTPAASSTAPSLTSRHHRQKSGSKNPSDASTNSPWAPSCTPGTPMTLCCSQIGLTA